MFNVASLNALILAFSPLTPAVGNEQTPQAQLPEIVVIGSLENLSKIPGSGQTLDQKSLESARLFTTNEALRKLPGVNVRDEEGFGLRPNIGVRGLNPTRSMKTTLLQDGIPTAYAPYGDNASYYHPPIDRFERIEVLKGAGQIAFGPQTIGGAINYITPTPPQKFGGSVSLSGGNRDYFQGKAQVGMNGLLFDYTRKEGDGARDNIHSDLNDVNLKAVLPLGEGHGITFNANLYTEDSKLTYTGLTEAELKNFGSRYNPFKNDSFQATRYGTSALHEIQFGRSTLATSLYYSYFTRDWWRQSSNTDDTQGGAAGTALRTARRDGQTINVDSLPSTQGRLRDYTAFGVEPRFKLPYTLIDDAESELSIGVRAHGEEQKRVQKNSTSPTGRDGAVSEDTERETRAYSSFLMNRFALWEWSVTPGIRYESVDAFRENFQNGQSGSDSINKWIPGIGTTWNPMNSLTLFAGVHKGFAPPRVEDIVNGNGTSTNVGAEESTNWELGARTRSAKHGHVDLTVFRNDFDRLIASGNIAGGSTPLAEGKALFQGLELSGNCHMPLGLSLRNTYTLVDRAEQKTVFKNVANGTTAGNSVAGNRQPYAPKHLLTAGLGFDIGGLNTMVEYVFVDEQFANFSNTRTTNVNGQEGVLPSYSLWNASVNYTVKSWGTTFFVTGKNLFDKIYIVDRTRGLQVGSPRLIQGGVKYAFSGNR
jgi:Fe(3+) dicitrate transport protein